jgi:hypothetical protein
MITLALCYLTGFLVAYWLLDIFSEGPEEKRNNLRDAAIWPYTIGVFYVIKKFS